MGEPASSPIVLRSPAELHALAAQGPRMLPGASSISLELIDVPPTVRVAWERKLASYSNTCGCKEATAALLAVALGYPALLIALAPPGLFLSLRGLVSWMLASMGAVVVGKIVGIAVARARLRRLIARIEPHLRVLPRYDGSSQ